MKKSWVISLIVVIVIASTALVFFQCSYNPDVKISGSICYDTEHHHILDVEDVRKCEIPPKVLGYYKTDDFILVKWELEYPVDAIYNKYDYRTWYYSGVLYWAIELKDETQVGPMDSLEFHHYCQSHHIKDVKFSLPEK